MEEIRANIFHCRIIFSVPSFLNANILFLFSLLHRRVKSKVKELFMMRHRLSSFYAIFLWHLERFIVVGILSWR